MRRVGYDAIVVGAGPNGLGAAIVLARAGLSVLIREADSTPGGGARSEPLTLPGFTHDVCSAVHPLGISSPLFRRLPLKTHGLEWLQPPVPLAHPFDEGPPALLERSTRATATWLGQDGPAWLRLMDPFVARWRPLWDDALGPLHLPRHPLLLARFGMLALLPTTVLTRLAFRGRQAPALFAGIAGHATLPLNWPPSAAFGFILGIAGHAVGWPMPRGGSGSLSAALISYFRALGGEIQTDARVDSLDDLPPARAVLLDVSPRVVLQIAGSALPSSYRRADG